MVESELKGRPTRQKKPRWFWKVVAILLGIYAVHHTWWYCCVPPDIQIREQQFTINSKTGERISILRDAHWGWTLQEELYVRRGNGPAVFIADMGSEDSETPRIRLTRDRTAIIALFPERDGYIGGYDLANSQVLNSYEAESYVSTHPLDKRDIWNSGREARQVKRTRWQLRKIGLPYYRGFLD